MSEQAREPESVLQRLSDDLARVVAETSIHVVRVDARPRLAASGLAWGGSAIVTADHVVVSEERITVGLPDGRNLPATLVGRDPTTDIAVLRLDVALPPLPRAGDGEVRVGHLALAVGRPGREGPMATLGLVSAVEGAWRTPLGGLVDRYIQADVTMLPGFSGGALVDAGGRVVGMLTSHLARGVAVVIPSETVERIVGQLLREGRVRRGYLGVSTQRVPLPSTLGQRLGQDSGLLVVTVESGSPAERGGLLLGDVIVGLDDQPVQSPRDLQALLGPERVGRPASVRIVRAGAVRDLQVVVGERG
ncbi:MAG TPA: trypsin-like peptidase domain-containing protein [Chloroflexota bacterium]